MAVYKNMKSLGFGMGLVGGDFVNCGQMVAAVGVGTRLFYKLFFSLKYARSINPKNTEELCPKKYPSIFYTYNPKYKKTHSKLQCRGSSGWLLSLSPKDCLQNPA
jgi:hypothetical protein